MVIKTVILFLGFLLGLYFASSYLENESENIVSMLKLEDEDILLYLEAITKIRDKDIFLEKNISRKKIVQESLKSYLNQQDMFSGYLTREEYLRFQESQNDRYVGVGMEIEKNKKGEIVCFPYPKSAAERAGISTGDRLVSVDGTPIKEKSILAIATLARGKQGTQIVFVVEKKNGERRKVSVTRSNVQLESIFKQKFEEISVLRIITFSPTSKLQIESIINTWDKDAPIVVDLRGNSGGDLHVSIDSAMLFLSKGKKILTVRARDKSKTYVSSTEDLSPGSPIFLWHDEATASAAEIFVAALTENGKAVSIGTKTFGKGTKQDIIELSDGSALVLTTGYLQTPKGTEYEGRGLAPTYELASKSPHIADYLAKTKELADLNKMACCIDLLYPNGNNGY